MDALFERLPALYYALALVVLLLPRPRLRALSGAGLALLALAAAAGSVPAAPTGDSSFVAINEGIGLAGFMLVLVGFGLSLRRDGFAGTPVRAQLAPALPGWDPLLLLGFLVGLVSSHLVLFGIGGALVIAAAARTTIRARHRFGLLVLLAGALLLGAGFVLLLTILGPEAGALARLEQAPVSLAAERILTLLFGSAALVFSGIPPFSGTPWGRRLSPWSALLLGRLIVPAFPLGLAIWQAGALLWVVLGFAWTAFSAPARAAVSLGGLFALWSGTAGIPAGAVLVTWAWLADVRQSPGSPVPVRWRGLTLVPVAAAALPALSAGLQTQVLLSVALVVATVAALLVGAVRPPRVEGVPL